MSGSEEKKLNSLHEEDSLYKAQGGKAAYQISPTYGQNTLYKVNPVHDAWDRSSLISKVKPLSVCFFISYTPVYVPVKKGLLFFLINIKLNLLQC